MTYSKIKAIHFTLIDQRKPLKHNELPKENCLVLLSVFYCISRRLIHLNEIKNFENEHDNYLIKVMRVLSQ